MKAPDRCLGEAQHLVEENQTFIFRGVAVATGHALDCRSHFNDVKITHLHLSLDQKVQNPVELLHHERHDAFLSLVNQGLGPARDFPAGGFEVNANDRKEFAILVLEGIGGTNSVLNKLEGYTFHIQLAPKFELREPGKNFRLRMPSVGSDHF